MSYGSDMIDLHRRSASYVDRILRGTKPAELPIQAPTKFQLFINLEGSQGTRPNHPNHTDRRADKVIE